MKYLVADRMGKPLSKKEIDSFLKEPNILRLAVTDSKDNSPIVHPVWFYYEEGRFFVATDKGGKKARSIKKNPQVYFLVDVNPDEGPPFGVRGKGIARVIDDTDFAIRINIKNVKKYLGSLQSKTAKKIIEMGKDSSVIEITPRYIASWKY